LSISNRERYKAIARFQRPGDLYIVELSDAETLKNWGQQGAPKQILSKGDSFFGNSFLRNHFQLGNKVMISEVKSGFAGDEVKDLGHGIISLFSGSPLVPPYETRVVAEDEHTLTYTDGYGRTCKALKNKYSMPQFIDWPVKDRATWKDLKKRLDPNTPERWPKNWDAYVRELNSKDDPVLLQVGGFYYYLREWIGSENILYKFYDDPGLIEDMMDQMLYMELEIIKRVVKDIKVDQADFEEDMAFRSGPFISPEMVRRFCMPRWKKITELLHSNGIDIIFVDCDGNVDKLIPLWLESGINFITPMEQTAGNDIVAYRKKYGKDLIIGGGIDKRALAKGKEAIKEEIMSKVPFLLAQGGYFPSVDHAVPPNVSYENYCYYINTLREVAGLEKLSF
jgi:hypothetical protein